MVGKRTGAMRRWPGNRIMLFGFVIINMLVISLSSPLAFIFSTQLPDCIYSVIWNVSRVTLNFRTVALFITCAYKRHFIQGVRTLPSYYI